VDSILGIWIGGGLRDPQETSTPASPNNKIILLMGVEYLVFILRGKNQFWIKKPLISERLGKDTAESTAE